MNRNQQSTNGPTVSGRSGALLATLAGANLWAVAVAIPAALAGREPLSDAATMLPLAVLGAGLFAARLRPALARVLLFVVFPLALSPALDVDPSPQGGWVGAATAVLSALSFVAYVAAVASTPALGEASIPTSYAPFAPGPIEKPPFVRARRAAVFGLCVLGAFALAVVAPSWDAPDARAAAFGPAADAASTLTTVVGGVLGALVLGAYLAPATRLERRRVSRGSGLRAAIYASIALAGVTVLALV